MNLKSVFDDVSLCGRPVSIDKKYFKGCMEQLGHNLDFKDEDSFWIPVNNKDENGEMKYGGKVRVSVAFMPLD